MPNSKSFKATLEEEYNFPAQYIFKFIVKTGLKQQILELLPGAKKSERVSKNGNYVSVTLSQIMKNSEEIVYIYEKASKIKGVISL